MALYTFGGSPSDVLTDLAGNVMPDYLVLVRRTGGTLVTALLEEDGTPIGELRTGATGSPAPGAIRPFKIEDVTEIYFEYLDLAGQPVRWYEAAREVAAGALATAGTALAEAAGKLDLDTASPQTVASHTTFTDGITAPGLADLPGARTFLVTGAAGDGTTDDRAAIQAQLDAAHTAGGGLVLLPPGRTYGVGTFLVVYDHTTIWAYGATLKAIGTTGLLRNFTSGETFPGYTGHSHIRVLGGTWDGNAADAGVGTVTAETDVINFVHCSDILVRDVTVLNTSTAHAVEINSTDGARVIDCTFLGFKDNSAGSVRQFSEAVQLDISTSGSSSIGDFDDTPARNVTVRGCRFGASARLGVFGRAIGSHTTAAGTYYDNVQVLGNRIDGTIQEGIRGYGWRRAAITGNVITGTGLSGIAVTVPDPAAAGYALAPHSITVQDNIIDAAADDSGIRVLGYPTAKAAAVAIGGNTLRNLGGNGIHAEHCTAPAITGNTIETTTSTGLYAHMSDHASITGNTLRSTGSNAINIAGTTGAVAAGNTVNTTGSNFGIFVGQSLGGTTDSTDALVTGNTVTAAASAGIRCSTNAARCTVRGNTVRKAGGTTANGISLAASATGCTVTGNDLSGNGWSAATALAVSTAAPVTGPGETTALPGTNRCDTDLTPLPALEAAMAPAGRYETTSRLRCGTNSTAAVSGTLYLVPIWLPKGLTLSSIAFCSGGTAAGTPANWWFALFNAARVALARTADQTTTAWASNTAKSLPIAQTTAGTASSYTTTYSGLHYLGIMVKAATVPSLAGEGAMTNGADAVPGFGDTNTGMTTPPTVTAGAFTAGAFGGNAGILAYAYVT